MSHPPPLTPLQIGYHLLREVRRHRVVSLFPYPDGLATAPKDEEQLATALGDLALSLIGPPTSESPGPPSSSPSCIRGRLSVLEARLDALIDSFDHYTSEAADDADDLQATVLCQGKAIALSDQEIGDLRDALSNLGDRFRSHRHLTKRKPRDTDTSLPVSYPSPPPDDAFDDPDNPGCL